MAVERPYEPSTWTTGDVITKNKIQHIEDGIAAIDAEIVEARKEGGSTTGTLGERLNDMIIVSDTQPASDNNELWIKTNTVEVEVPTYDEMDNIIKIQDTQPTEHSNKVWFDTTTIEEVVLPEIDDNSISQTDTWSSNKINIIKNDVSALKEIINGYDALVADVEGIEDGIRIQFSDDSMKEIPIQSGIAGLHLFYDNNNYLHLYDENDDDQGDPQFIVGGGGGGGSGYTYTLTFTNNLPSRIITVSAGSPVVLAFTYTSIDKDGIDDGDGVGTIRIDNIARGNFAAKQGSNTLDISSYLKSGTNKISLSVENSEGSRKSLSYTVTVVVLNITTTFDTTGIYNDAINFPYTVTGSGTKEVYFTLNNNVIGHETVTTSGRERTYTIPKQPHGSYTLKVYATIEVDGITATSNVLTIGMMWIDSANATPLILSTYTKNEAVEGETINIPYMIYDPLYETASVTLSVIDENGDTYSTNTINQGRTLTSWSIQNYPSGDVTFRIECRGTTLDFEFEVEEYQFPLDIVTDGLKLEFTAAGRTNSEDNPENWSYTNADNETYTATFDGFGWTNADGWVYDSDNTSVLRFLPGDTMTIPFYPFARDARETGFTVEVELATRDVRDYESIVLSCLSGEINGVGGIGFRIQSQVATLRTQGITSGLSMMFKEDSHIRVAFAIEPRNSNRLIYIYINGVMCGAIQYDTNDNIQQANPVGLTIGAQSCGIDLYRIRCYARGLDRNEQLDNYICDRATLAERQDSYTENDILNDSTGEVSVDKLPNTLPYMIIKSIRMPTFKGDKLDADISFIDPVHKEKSFEATGCSIDVQGTSSAGYPVKNSKIKLKNIVVDGVAASSYVIKDGEKGIKTLCTKVDYASSEGANNVELVQLYELICKEQGLLIPPQENDSTVRQGISGRPIVIFWQNSETNTVTFYGKANMNWDKGNPEAFGFTLNEVTESWEFKNNTSNHCLFKSGDMTGWENDFEARYPEDYTDVSKLGAVLSWVASTDTTAATDDALESAATYDGTTYTTDSAEYRLAKFKNEFEDWFVKDLCIFYYIFTATFLMVDSRAKNMFLTTYDGEHWLPLPYDMDTAIGINNEGELVFEYNLEDTDTVAGSQVFNGQRSVLWNNVREVFGSDISTMYRNLRTTSRYFNYEYVKNMFEEHQSVWPERLWNEDAFTKYLQPFLIDGTDNLDMLQGSKESQRDWWLFNAFRYWDSKYQTGDANTNVITLRTYASGDIDIVPYSHIYAHLRYGSYDVVERATRNELITLYCPFDPTESANDTETYLYSADRIAQIGDLSPLNVGYADFSAATKLQTLKLGDDDSEYTNTQLNTLTVGNNELLTSLDISNCVALAANVNLSGCTGIETVKAKGSSIAGVSLPNGGHLKTLLLPETVTNLTIQNQNGLTNFSIDGYDYLQTLRIENTPNIPLETIINNADNLAYVRLVDVNWTATDETALQATIDKLEGCYGQDASGRNTDKAVVIGRVNISSISNELMAEIVENFPNLIVVVNGVAQYVVSFINYDNSVVYREVIAQGGNAYDPVSAGYATAPTRPDDADGLRGYSYKGWESIPTNVQNNISVMPTWNYRWRVRYLNYDNSVLQSSLVINNGNATYSGATPTRPGDVQYSYTFSGWNGNQTRVTEPRDIVAVYTPTTRMYEFKFYNGSTLANTYSNLAYGTTTDFTPPTPTHPEEPDGYSFNNWSTQDGVVYEVGMTVNADYNFYATWIDMNSVLAKYLRGTLTEYEGFGDTIATDAFYAREELTSVKTTATTIQEYAFRNLTGLTTVELTSTNAASIGANAFYGCNKLQVIILNSTSLTTLSNTNALSHTVIEFGEGGIYVPAGLVAGYKAATNWSAYADYIYSIDDYPVTDFSTISDSWEEIITNINNGDAESLYKIGDTKLLLDVDGNKMGYMQLAAFNGDVLSDGETPVATTWIMKNSYGNGRSYNSTSTTAGGWAESDLREYLQNTDTGVITKLPTVVRNAIKTVQKTYCAYESSSTLTCNDTLWIPSYREVMAGTDVEDSGVQYSELFGTSINVNARRSRIKINSSLNIINWWLRSPHLSYASGERSVSSSGLVNYSTASSTLAVVPAFCI